MHAFHIAGGSSLLRALVAARLRELYPAAVVRSTEDADLPGVRVGLPGDRWLYLAPSTEVEEGAVEALSAGANAVIHLGSSSEEFDRAIAAVLEGEGGFVPVDIMQWMAQQALARGEARTANALDVPLTQREREILQLVSRGYSNGEIAAALTISTNTVRTHLHALSTKLNANSRTRMLANARALAIPEALDFQPLGDDERVSA